MTLPPAPRVPWDEIDCVLLDMDGTLLDLRYDNHFWCEHLPRRYAETRGIDPEAAKAELYPRFRRIEGTLAWYCIDHWTRELGLDVGALKHEVADLIGMRADAEAFLRRLRSHFVRTVVVTNAHPRTIDLKLERTMLHDLVGVFVNAHELGAAKEDRAFWTGLRAREPFDPRRTLLIDDNVHALRAARDFGIGHLCGISRPDSTAEPRPPHEFAVIEHFHELGAPASGLVEGASS